MPEASRLPVFWAAHIKVRSKSRWLDSAINYDILLMRRVRKMKGEMVIQKHTSFCNDQGCGRWMAASQAGRSAWPTCASIARAFARRSDSSSNATKSRKETQRV